MPQTSPINWVTLSLCIKMSMLIILSLTNEKMTYMKLQKMKFNMLMKPWNW